MQSFAVIGLGRFGSRLAKNLAGAGRDVIAIDQRKRVIEEIRDHVTMAVALDATDEAALQAQGVDQVDAAVVGIGADFEAAALVTVNLKHLGVPHIVSRALTRRGGSILERIGANKVVHAEDESADRWSMNLAFPNLLGHHELDKGNSIVEIKTPPSWIGKTLSEIRLRQDHGLLAVAVKHHPTDPTQGSARPTLQIPKPDQPLAENDVLVLMGADQNIARLPST